MKFVLANEQFEKGVGYFFTVGDLIRIDGKLCIYRGSADIQKEVVGEKVLFMEVYVDPILELQSVQED